MACGNGFSCLRAVACGNGFSCRAVAFEGCDCGNSPPVAMALCRSNGVLLKAMVVCFKMLSTECFFGGKVCSVECAAYFDRWDLYLFVC